ncbi:MAG: ribose-5-phosphate isomerase RpiA [Chloroflexi bacterium]|nr:ribose-5-phosphate isomerase RpiA [Chloroflexota bacterium]MCI0892919.1 ribose-5-phosphate isomerase RpiA [Chloroflexota bacterium]
MTEAHKESSARKAVEFVESGMIVGLGSGSTAIYAVREIARKLKQGELSGILGVPTSLEVEHQAAELGIPLTTLEDHPPVDLTIDGADEVDPQLDLIKGGGGALLREKILAQASQREIIVVDETKLSDHLGTRIALPVEVLPFGWAPEADYLKSLGASVSLRKTPSGEPAVTDQGNWILDAEFGPIEDPAALAEQLDRRAAVAAHGLFLGLATDLIVGGRDGVRHEKRP